MGRGTWLGRGGAAAIVAAMTVACVGLGEGRSDMLARAACPELGGGAMSAQFSADAKINASVRAFVQASSDLRQVSIDAEGAVIQACQNMAADLQVQTQPAGSDTADAKVHAACDPVLAKIDSIMKAAGTARLDVTYTPPECQVQADAYASCAGQCNVNVDPGYVVAHCTPGYVSGYCEGECNGKCEGTCNGTCNGNCSAKNAQGQCTGFCDGSCTGQCSATCHAECKGQWKAPHCDVAAKEPSVDAKCDAACHAHADISARCTDPHVDIKASAGVAEMGALIATLSKNLPILIRVEIGYGKRLADDIAALVDVSADLGKVIGEAGAHAASCIGAAGSEIVEAQASVRVSVSVSASVSGRVSGGTG